MTMQSIMRIDLIRIAQASECASSDVVCEYVDKLTASGPYTEATENEIEQYDKIEESELEGR